MKARAFGWAGWVAGCAIYLVGCGSGGGSAAPGAGGEDGRGGTGSGGTGSGGTSSGGGSSAGGETGSGGGMSEGGAGGVASGGAGTGGSGTGGSTAACLADERRCMGEQPQNCVASEWQDDGDPCAVFEPCNQASGACEVSSSTVPGGTFARSYDVTPNTYNDDTWPATVSAVRLDRYEVSVGQFRRFAAAVLAGWRPTAGSGKHTHLNGGSGLVNSGAGGGYEGGWSSEWNSELPATEQAWNDARDCSQAYPTTWTPTPSTQELHAINCVSWYEAYAYCIWDGGFLPSEAEWNFAAAGGTEQRSYAWGEAAASASRAVYNTSGAAAVGSKPDGAGRWGHLDLAGNVEEWTVDWFTDSYVNPCTDCAYLTAQSTRVARGGMFFSGSTASQLRTGYRSGGAPSGRFPGMGIRCARAI